MRCLFDAGMQMRYIIWNLCLIDLEHVFRLSVCSVRIQLKTQLPVQWLRVKSI